MYSFSLKKKLCVVSVAFQSEPLYVPVKFHDLPSGKPEGTSVDTEKSEQNLQSQS